MKNGLRLRPFGIPGVPSRSVNVSCSAWLKTSRLQCPFACYRSASRRSTMLSSFPALAVFLAQHRFTQYVRQHFFDTTFKGLYHANAFDMALLIPYFVVLILLASYGIHRYTLVYLYYKKKHNATKPPQPFTELPFVTI